MEEHTSSILRAYFIVGGSGSRACVDQSEPIFANRSRNYGLVNEDPVTSIDYFIGSVSMYMAFERLRRKSRTGHRLSAT